MAKQYLMPYTNLHELNLDWLINAMKQLESQWDSYGSTATARAFQLPEGAQPTVTVDGTFKDGEVVFNFGIPDGSNGATFTPSVSSEGVISWTNNKGKENPNPVNIKGPKGEQGAQGPAGTGLYILDVYSSLSALQAAHPTGLSGDAYLVGTNPNYILYIWGTSTGSWIASGSLTSPSPSSTTPLMNADSATTGVENRYARGDHAHPHDSTKLDKKTSSFSTALYAQSGESQIFLDASTFVLQDELNNKIATKQDLLVSGTNIKSINGSSILGSGDITITSGISYEVVE